MPNYMTKGYDANQVIRSVYDVNKNCLRVCIDGTIEGPGGGLEIVIDHANDSIRLGDGTNLTTTTTVGADVGLDVNVLNPIAITDGTDSLGINNDGSINVNVIGSSNVVDVNKYGEISSLASGVETILTTHVAVIGTLTYLQLVYASGQNIAEYKVKINGTTIDTKRTNFGTQLNVEFNFKGTSNNGVLLNVGDIVTITTIHQRGMTADFNGRIQLIEIT